jgi:large subunit ribosomal protein L21
MSYAIIRVGGKQYRVSEGETLLVDRLKTDEGKTFTPDLLFVPDGDGKGVTVTAKVVGHVKGEKIRIGKYRRRTGYKKHTGHRSRLTRIEIESIGAATRAKAAAKPKSEEAAPKKSAPAVGVPEGYASMTIAQLTEAASGWSREQIEAALEHERSGKARKGALTALESALEEKQ